MYDGVIWIIIQGQFSEVWFGESVFVFVGLEIRVEFLDKYVCFWVYLSGDGFDVLIFQGGDLGKGVIVFDEVLVVDYVKVKFVVKVLNVVFSFNFDF